jgi:hypothetical protein
VEAAGLFDSPDDHIVRRVLDTPSTYRRWISEHDSLLRGVSTHNRVEGQVVALRAALMNLVHRMALFEYLRDRQLSAAKRQRLLALFYHYRDYANAVVTEHGNYVRCLSSHVCAEYLAQHLMHDAAVSEPMQLYGERFAEFFRAFCDAELAETEDERQAAEPLSDLRPLLKLQLAESRQAILGMALAPEREWREVQIRRPTGETQRLRALSGGNGAPPGAGGDARAPSVVERARRATGIAASAEGV